MSYESIKALAAETRGRSRNCNIKPKNDPFYSGCPAKIRDAQWFFEVWQRFGFGNGVHLRRIHYRIVSEKDPVLLPNGMPYTNTLECWNYLGDASKAARYQRLVDPAAFIDRRNPDPKIFATSRPVPVVPNYRIEEPDWSLPSVDIQLESRLNLPRPDVSGYDYELADQLAISCRQARPVEKAPHMDDILSGIPLMQMALWRRSGDRHRVQSLRPALPVNAGRRC